MTDITNYEVLQNEKYGRYLVASKDLEAGELIFTDTPFAAGPKPDSPPICLGCYAPVEASLCGLCGWPLCAACGGAGAGAGAGAAAHAAECGAFAAAGVRFQPVADWSAIAPQLDCITPLRMLLAKERDPERWRRELELLETHTEARRRRPGWDADQVNVVNFLVDHCKLGARFDKELVQRVCGILEVNSIELPPRGGASARGVCPRLALAAHCCVPNLSHTVLRADDDYRVEVRAAIPIKAGASLFLSYTHVLAPTLLRRLHLQESKFFECDCARCADPSELGTHLGTLLCSKCAEGVLLSSNPLDNEARWQCTSKACQFSTAGAAVLKLLQLVQAELDELDELDELQPSAAALQRREAFLSKYKSVFHPHHALLASVKLSLAQLYGRAPGYDIGALPDVLLERKAALCRLLLQLLDAVAPGETRMRAMLQYELHAPLMYLARNEYAAGVIPQSKLGARLQPALQCLAAAARVLGREEPRGPEGAAGRAAAAALRELTASIEALPREEDEDQ